MILKENCFILNKIYDILAELQAQGKTSEACRNQTVTFQHYLVEYTQ